MNPDYIKAVAALYNAMVDDIARDALPELTRRELTKVLTGMDEHADVEQVLSQLSPATRDALLRDALRQFVEGEIAKLEDRGIIRYRNPYGG